MRVFIVFARRLSWSLSTAVTGLAESSPSNLKFEGGSAIAAPMVSADGLDDELLFVVLGHYQW